MVRSWGGRETVCYWADERDAAEARLPFTPVNPVDIVGRYTGLGLTQVLLVTGPGVDPGKPITRISYIFGTIPGAPGCIPDPAPPEPEFVMVTEQAGAFAAEPRLDRTEYHTRQVGSNETRTVYGNWQLLAALPGDVHVVVTANLGEGVVESMGRAMVGADSGEG